MSLSDLFPVRDDTFCSCGCGLIVKSPKKRWATIECRKRAVTLFLIVKGDSKTIRREVYNRDRGICNYCDNHVEIWHADHILPIRQGGSACDLDNFQTLCLECHKNKSRYSVSHHNLYSSQEA